MAAPLAFFGTESCYVRSLNLSDGSSTCYAVTEPTTKYVAVEFVISELDCAALVQGGDAGLA